MTDRVTGLYVETPESIVTPFTNKKSDPFRSLGSVLDAKGWYSIFHIHDDTGAVESLFPWTPLRYILPSYLPIVKWGPIRIS